MSFQINDVPTEDPLNNGGEATTSWEDWFTRLSDAVKGPWGDQGVTIAGDLGEDAQINQSFLRYHGDTVYFYVNVSDLDAPSPVQVTLPDSKILDGIYHESQDGTVTGRFMQNRTITIPAEALDTYVISGTFMRSK